MGRPWSDLDRERFAERNILKASTVPAKRHDGPDVDEWDDPFDDDTPLVCGLENPETCESCQ